MVTVVFADLAASTELAAGLDPERFREVLAAFHGMVSEHIAALGGRAEGFIGDAVLGVFGIPMLHDDDAERGIRAALAIVDDVPRLTERLGLRVPIQVRVGVNTGQVAVGTAADRNIVIGAEVNRGARLQQAAAPGEVLAGETTHQLAGDGVVFGEMRTIQAKGFEEAMPAWPALHIAGSHAPRSIPLTGRRRELAMLTGTFERVRARGRAHLVTLLGEPGIGKTRVVEEFLASVSGEARVLIGRSSPFEEQVTFWPLAQMVYGEIGLERGAPEEEISAGLRAFLAALGEAGDEERTARRLGLALGLGEEGSDENRYHAAEVRRGMLSLITAMATQQPVILVFENAHDADPLLLDLVEQLVREARSSPVMVICLARWELFEDRPSWAGGLADAVTLWVEPLTLPHGTELAMAAGDLPRADAERVAEHAGGNPYFIIEIVGMLRREEAALPQWGPAPTTRLLPATVQAVVAARIDQLSAPARNLVLRASVFPRGRFDLDELAMLVEPREELLAEVEDHEVLVPEEDRPGVWRFGSDVLRDVAYDSLAKRERQRLHLRVAEALEQGEGLERYPRTIAFHLEHAAMASLDLDPRDRSLAERAVEALAKAGDIARTRIESRSAADLYVRALALAGSEGQWGEREARICSLLGEAQYWLGEFDDAEAMLHRALAIAGEESDRVTAHASRFLGDITLAVRADPERAEDLFTRAIEAARRLDDPVVLARALLMGGGVWLWRGDLTRAAERYREALEAARAGEGPDAWAESRALAGLAEVTSPAGDERDALATALEALAVGEDANQAFTAAAAHATVASSLRKMLQLEEAFEHVDAAIETFRELGARWELASALGDRAAIRRLQGDLDEGEADAREALALCRNLEERAIVSWTAAELARILAMRGDWAAARAVLADPVARLAEGEPGSATSMLIAETVVALAEGERGTAIMHSQAAIEAEAADGGTSNARAALIWWTGRLFGPEAAGGPQVLQEAHDLLARHHWRQALQEPELVASLA